MANKWFKKPWAFSITALMLLLLFAVACGTAAPPADTSAPATSAPEPAKTAPDTAAPAKTAPDTSAPAITSSDAVDAQTAGGGAPTAVPAAAAAPEEVVVNPGLVVLMVSSFGTERFDTVYGQTVKELRKHFHGNLTSWDSFDGAMQITPGIASKWELSNGLKNITYTIMEGAMFHDGTEITPEDVLWTLRHSVGPGAETWGYGSVTPTYARNMDRIDLGPGPNQVTVYSTVPIPEAPVYWSENEGGASMAQILPKREKLHDPAEVEAYDRNPIGAGPVKLVKHIPLETIFFERHDDFYYQPANGFRTDKRLKFRDLELRLVPDESTRAAALRAGEADIGRVSPSTQSQVEKGGGRLVLSPESVIIESHFWGCFDPQLPCTDKRVRQAFNMALDKSLMQELFGGAVAENLGWWVVTPSTIGYSPELKPWPFDPVRARQLFTEAGYKNPDNPNGKDFGTMVINTHPDEMVPDLIAAARLAASLWEKELGIDTEVRVMDKVSWRLLRNDNLPDLAGQLNWVSQNTRLDAAGIMRGYFVTVRKGFESTGASRVHKDQELFDLVNETLAATGKEGYVNTYNATFLRLQEESYQISVGYLNAPIGVGPRILTWEPYGVAEYISALHTITLK